MSEKPNTAWRKVAAIEDAMAAGHVPVRTLRTTIDALVAQLELHKDNGSGFRSAYRRAKVLQATLADPNKVKKLRDTMNRAAVEDVVPPGILPSRSLDSARHQIQGGLPGSSRGH